MHVTYAKSGHGAMYRTLCSSQLVIIPHTHCYLSFAYSLQSHWWVYVVCYNLLGKLIDWEQELLQSSTLTDQTWHTHGVLRHMIIHWKVFFFSLYSILSSFLKTRVTSAFVRSTGNDDSQIAWLIIGRRVLKGVAAPIRISLGGWSEISVREHTIIFSKVTH